MKSRIVFFLAAAFLLCAAVIVIYAQPEGKPAQSDSGRIDMKTKTRVGKRVEKAEEINGKKVTHMLYRVEAVPTAKLPRYTVDYRYNIKYKTESFKPGDTITKLSANAEEDDDSPIWTYLVTYTGSGTRSIVFTTGGSAASPAFATVSGETEECEGCGCDLTGCGSHACSKCNPCCANPPGCYSGCQGCGCDCHGGPTPCEICNCYPCECEPIPPDDPPPGEPPCTSCCII